jgi:glycosyltransferase involved in cell wall biosynthesis
MARIGVNALYLIPGGVGGTEIYLRELLAALGGIDTANEYFVFTNLETSNNLVPRQANFHWKPQAVHATFRPARILWEQIVLPIEASRYHLDVLFNPGFTAPIFAPCRSVTVFHDLQHKRHPEYFRWFDLPMWRFLLWASARRSHKLIAPSEATRADLKRFYPFTKDHITVIPHGVDPAFFTLDRAQIDSYILCVSTLHPHKNLERVVKQWRRSPTCQKLILAGMHGFQTESLKQRIADLGISNVELPGWLPRADLMNLYAHARAFIYPSTFEGFGMPVLEAMAAGIPVACSDIAPLREIAGDAVLFFDPEDDAAIASALDRIANDEPLRTRLSKAGPAQARPFTWTRAAQQTLGVLI